MKFKLFVALGLGMMMGLANVSMAAPEMAPVDRVTGSLVTLKVAGADLKDVLAKVAEQTGNGVLSLPENWKGKSVTADFDRKPYWQAIDELCKTQGLVYQADMQKGGLKLVPGVDIGGVTSYAGPVVFKITSGSASHSAWDAHANAGISFQVSAFWENRLKPASSQPVVIDKLTDDQGADLKAQVGNNDTFEMFRAMGKMPNGPASMPPVGGFFVKMMKYPEGMTKLGEMSGRYPLMFAIPEGTKPQEYQFKFTGVPAP
jgi:hypothetical protein